MTVAEIEKIVVVVPSPPIGLWRHSLPYAIAMWCEELHWMWHDVTKVLAVMDKLSICVVEWIYLSWIDAHNPAYS